MAFFPRNFNTESSFHPLFRLLDDYESYANNSGSHATRGRTALPTFSPKFDVRELDDAFELHGELAGIAKENVHIEFSDPNTLHVRGRIERSYTAGTPPAGLLEGKATASITEGGEEQKSTSHKATVEDDKNDTESTSDNAVTKSDGQNANKERKNTVKDSAKYWVSERSIGEFNRTFNFPGHIQQEGVTANLENGILTVRVPKAPKHKSHRIQIN